MKDITASERAQILEDWEEFLKCELGYKVFTDALHSYLSQRCGFGPPHNRDEFYSMKFGKPENAIQFLSHFDRSERLGVPHYVGDGVYDAMMDIAGKYLEKLRSMRR